MIAARFEKTDVSGPAYCAGFREIDDEVFDLCGASLEDLNTIAVVQCLGVDA